MTTLIIATDARRIGGIVAAARTLGESVDAVAVGDSALAEEIAAAGVDKVLHFAADANVPPEAYAGQVAAKAKEVGANVVISNDGPAARVILGAVAGALGAAVVGSVVELGNDGGLTAGRLVANEKAIETVRAQNALAAVYVGADEDIVAGSAPIEAVSVEAPADTVVAVEQAGGSGLSDARRVVGVGMGVAARDNLPIVEDLAKALGAEIACTLPCCDDMRWYGSDRVLGSSHNTAAPDLYVAVGISGSPNHTSGFRDAKMAVAINKDPDAEIFTKCKYGIVGDLFDVVPVLTAAL